MKPEMPKLLFSRKYLLPERVKTVRSRRPSQQTNRNGKIKQIVQKCARRPKFCDVGSCQPVSLSRYVIITAKPAPKMRRFLSVPGVCPYESSAGANTPTCLSRNRRCTNAAHCSAIRCRRTSRPRLGVSAETRLRVAICSSRCAWSSCASFPEPQHSSTLGNTSPRHVMPEMATPIAYSRWF